MTLPQEVLEVQGVGRDLLKATEGVIKVQGVPLGLVLEAAVLFELL